MANRSDYHSRFPRQFKRQLALSEARGEVADAHRRGEIRRLLIGAHDHARTHEKAIIGQREQVDEATQAALTKAAAPKK